MHLGPTASFLATALGSPEPTSRMLSRMMRERGWTEKGPRGRNSPHVSSTVLANFLIAFMSCPDSPAIAMERLPHFSSLPADSKDAPGQTFSTVMAALLTRLSSNSWQEAIAREWRVTLFVNISAAVIRNTPDNEHERSEYSFLGVMNSDPKDVMPYSGGLEFTSDIYCYTLFRIAKVVLANEPDPLEDMINSSKEPD